MAGTILSQEGGIELLRIFGPQFEDVPHFDRPADLQGLSGLYAQLAHLDGAQIVPGRDLQIAVHLDMAQMETVFIGPCGHAPGPAQGFVGINGHRRRLEGGTDRAQRTRAGTEQLHDLVGSRLTNLDRTRLGHELGLIERVVSPDEHQNGLRIGNEH